MSIGIEVGKKLKAIREAKGWKQHEVETKCGIKREYLSKIERPDEPLGFPNITMKTIERLLVCYGYSFQRFFKEIGR